MSMEKVEANSRFLKSLNQIVEESEVGDLKLSRVFEVFAEEGHAAIILFLCLPFIQPIPLPGLSTPLGAMIVLIGFLLLIRKPLFLPQRFDKNNIHPDLMRSVQRAAIKIWSYSANILKPRLLFLTDRLFFRILNFLVILICSILLALPLPIPFSNTVPVLGIITLSLGQLEKDGLFVLLSYAWLIIVFTFFYFISVGVWEIFF